MNEKTKLTKSQIKGRVRMIAEAAENLSSLDEMTFQRNFGVTKDEAQRNIAALLRRLMEEI